jgi:hypothetical protein
MSKGKRGTMSSAGGFGLHFRRCAAGAALGAVAVAAAGIPASNAAAANPQVIGTESFSKNLSSHDLLEPVPEVLGNLPTSPTSAAEAPAGSREPTEQGSSEPAAGLTVTDDPAEPTATVRGDGTGHAVPTTTTTRSAVSAPAGVQLAAPTQIQQQGQGTSGTAGRTPGPAAPEDPSAGGAESGATSMHAVRIGDAGTNRHSAASVTESVSLERGRRGVEVSVWWGLGLVLTGATAVVLFFRMSRPEQLHVPPKRRQHN